MSVAHTCAITLPSLYSTMACTVDWGCTTTSTSFGSKSNNQQASMTSKPLFINVAESMVMRLPIFQVGCFRACAGNQVPFLCPPNPLPPSGRGKSNPGTRHADDRGHYRISFRRHGNLYQR